MKTVKDETGKPIKERDVIRVFHFIGARRKKHYMYKYVVVKNEELYALHTGKLLLGEPEGYYLWTCEKDGLIQGTKILNDE